MSPKSDGRVPAISKSLRDEIASIIFEEIQSDPNLLPIDEEAIKKFVPEWDGKHETPADRLRFWELAQSTLGFEFKTAKEVDFPKGFLEAAGTIEAKYEVARIAAENPSKIRRLLSEMSPIEAFDKVWQGFATTAEARRKGGEARKKLNHDQELIARQLISAELRRGVSRTAACTHAAATMYRQHGIRVSAKTLSRLIASSGRDNA